MRIMQFRYRCTRKVHIENVLEKFNWRKPMPCVIAWDKINILTAIVANSIKISKRLDTAQV